MKSETTRFLWMLAHCCSPYRNAVFFGRTDVASPVKFQNQSIERVGYCSGGGNL